MANFTALKTAINNAIKTNGNEEITGAVLQVILDAMVETLGESAITNLENSLAAEVTNRENAVGGVASDLTAEAEARAALDYQVNNRINQEEYNRQNADAALSQTMSQGFSTLGSQMNALSQAISALNAAYQNGFLYGGVVTPSSSPANGKCFYIALQGGTYTNFGGVGVVQGINILKNDNGWKVEHIYDQTTLLNEFYLLRQQVIQAITSFAPIVIEGDVTNAPDEEDLTSNAQHLLQFKNNAYSPLEFSGLGRKYLRKNIAPLSESAAFNGFVEGVTAEETLSGTPEYIFWDRMNTRFVGIKDGVYYADWSNSGNYVPASTSLVYMYQGTPYKWDGSDFSVDETEVPNLVNCLTQDMINETNTIYIIRYDYTLKEDITIPANCVLQFDGGSISGEHTITGTNTAIQAGLVKIFSTDITLAGTWNVAEAYPEWFGAVINDSSVDNSIIIQKTIEHFQNVQLQKGKYYIYDTIIIPHFHHLYGMGRYNTELVYNNTSEVKYAIQYGNAYSYQAWEGSVENLKITRENEAGCLGLYTTSCLSIKNVSFYGLRRAIYLDGNHYFDRMVIDGVDIAYCYGNDDDKHIVSLNGYGDTTIIKNVHITSNRTNNPDLKTWGIYINSRNVAHISGIVNCPIVLNGCKGVTLQNFYNEWSRSVDLAGKTIVPTITIINSKVTLCDCVLIKNPAEDINISERSYVVINDLTIFDFNTTTTLQENHIEIDDTCDLTLNNCVFEYQFNNRFATHQFGLRIKNLDVFNKYSHLLSKKCHICSCKILNSEAYKYSFGTNNLTYSFRGERLYIDNDEYTKTMVYKAIPVVDFERKLAIGEYSTKTIGASETALGFVLAFSGYKNVPALIDVYKKEENSSVYTKHAVVPLMNAQKVPDFGSYICNIPYESVNIENTPDYDVIENLEFINGFNNVLIYSNTIPTKGIFKQGDRLINTGNLLYSEYYYNGVKWIGNAENVGIFLKCSGTLSQDNDNGNIALFAMLKDTNLSLFTPYINQVMPRISMSFNTEYDGYLEIDKTNINEIGTIPSIFSDSVVYLENLKDATSLTTLGWVEGTKPACKITFSGNISNLSGLSSLTSLQLASNFNGNYVNGDINVLSSLVSLTAVNLRFMGKIQGKWEDMIAAMCSNRTSGTLKINGRGSTYITFFDKNIDTIFPSGNNQYLYVIFSATGCTICTDSAGTDVLYTYTSSNDTWTENT